MSLWPAEDVLTHIATQIASIKEECKYKDTHTAFVDWALRAFYGLSPADANQACSYSATGDGGIDAFWVDHAKRRVYVIQGKTSDPLTKIATFNDSAVKDLQNVLNSFHNIGSTSGMLRHAALEFQKRISSKYSASFVALISGYPAPALERAQENFNAFFSDNRKKYAGFHCEIKHLSDINQKINSMLAQDVVARADLNYGRVVSQEGYHKKQGAPEAVILDLPIIEIGELVKKYSYGIIQKNLRYPLISEYNDSILGTLKDPQEKHMFWYYNNGVTIVCEKLQTIEGGGDSLVFSLINPQIVNGGQTAFTIARFMEENPDYKKKLDGVRVLTRVIAVGQTESNGGRSMAESIAKFTNSQNAITNRDLRANDHVQTLLQQKFHTLKYFYERKEGEWRAVRGQGPRTKAGFTRGVVKNELLGQLAISFWLKKPQEAKNEKNGIFREGTAGHYQEIFNPGKPYEISAEDLLLPYLTHRLLRHWVSEWKSAHPLSKRKRNSPQLIMKWEIIKNADQYLLSLTGEVLRRSLGVYYFTGKDESKRKANADVIAHCCAALSRVDDGKNNHFGRALFSFWESSLRALELYISPILKKNQDMNVRKILIKKSTYKDAKFQKDIVVRLSQEYNRRFAGLS